MDEDDLSSSSIGVSATSLRDCQRCILFTWGTTEQGMDHTRWRESITHDLHGGRRRDRSCLSTAVTSRLAAVLATARHSTAAVTNKQRLISSPEDNETIKKYKS